MTEYPPLFSDIGKSARDIIYKGYNYGISKIQVKSKFNESELNSSVRMIHETATSRGHIEHKHQWPKYGFILTNKWNTENIFTVIFEIKNSILDGLKSTFETQISPNTGNKTGAIKNDFKQNSVRANVDVSVDFAGSIVNNGLVYRHNNWCIGAGACFDVTKSQLHSKSFALQYSEPDITLHTSLLNNSEFCGSFIRKVNDRTDMAAIFNWSSIGDDTKMSLGFKHALDDRQTFRAKVNNSKQIALSYQIEMSTGVLATVSTQIEGKNLQGGGHKIGVGLEINV